MKKRITALAISLCLLLGCGTPAFAANSTMQFSDVKQGSWYYEYVRDLYEAKVIAGTTPTTFNPQGKVTLGEALKLILLAAGCPEQKPTSAHWASGYYKLAQSSRYLPANFSMALDECVNRQQFATIAANALGLSRLEHRKSPFIDSTDANVLALYDYGIVTGSRNASGYLEFNPRGQITRAEISAMIWRAYQLEKEGQVPEQNHDPAPTPPTDPDPAVPADENIVATFNYLGHRVNITGNIPASPYEENKFVKDSRGWMTYTGSGFTYKTGIDVSKYQGEIDWKAVKAAGIDFAIIRLGFRGYGEAGRLVRDAYFEANIQGALDAGLEVGVYFFSQAITPAEAAEEAAFTMSYLKGYDITWPVVFDWEPYTFPEARTYGLSDKTLTECTAAFCRAIKKGGYQPMVYSNLQYFYLHLNVSQLADYPFWLARYNSHPGFYYNFAIWQYGDAGNVPGIKGNVDMNIALFPKK